MGTRYLKLVLILAVAGVFVAGWLLSTHVKLSAGQAGLTEGCMAFSGAAGAGCEKVALSGYSYLFGVIPLAAVALGYYLALALLVFWAWKSPQTAYEPLYVSFNLATLAIVVTVIMYSISRFVLGEFCVGCAMLWLINLSIWPTLAKQLGLGWSGALAANLETIRPKNLQLKKERVTRGYVLAAGFVVALSVIGVAAKALQTQATMFGGSDRGVEEFRVAQRVFLPPEAFGGSSAKGLTDASKTPVLDIVKFSDFQCPACRMAAQYLKPFVTKNAAKVRLTYRNFPLDGSCNPYAPNGGHRAACIMSLAAICAGE
ncbi:MAG: thioredoxin domain-containing protein, partial [Bdellovibrionales bacterium]|nr:thioredoxin domain-containing protein [Bdellovibrionales bacterium]